MRLRPALSLSLSLTMTRVGSAVGGTPSDQLGGGGSIPTSTLSLFGAPSWRGEVWSIKDVADVLERRHYLGPATRGWAWVSDHGVMVFANPSSRRLPANRWLELVRWCLNGTANDGSRQWSVFRRWVRRAMPRLTTVISYSDPSVGHTGALYRSCGWWWAPTWLRLRPPPTGHGAWSEGGKAECVKDRWVFPLADDPDRPLLMTVQDESILRRWPTARYAEPGGVPYRLLREITESAGAP